MKKKLRWHKKNYSPIIHYVLFNKVTSLQKLLEKGADPDYSGLINRSNINVAHTNSLIMAILEEKIEIVKLLLKYKANPNNLSYIYSPLIMAASIDHLEIFLLLLNYGADPTIETKYKADFIDKIQGPKIENWLLQEENQEFLLSRWPSLIFSFKNNKIELTKNIKNKYSHLLTAKELNLI